jgi:hypothetical protein
VKFKSISTISMFALLAFCGVLQAQDSKTFQPFEIVNKTTPTTLNNQTGFYYQDPTFGADGVYDFLEDMERGPQMTKNQQGIFGEELVMGMKFADWLTLRLSVIDEDQPLNLFTPPPVSQHNSDDMFGYQFGVSSVLNLNQNWRFGIDLGMGKVGGETLGLYEDQVQTTRLGFGIRNQKFGATFQSDFMNSTSTSQIDQSTMDLQVDWHFTKDGTLSFGARRNIRDSAPSGTSIDELTGTVPYIKFKHNL